MKKGTLTIILMALMGVTGCISSLEMEEQFLHASEISLTWRGTAQVIYVPESFQLGYNDSRNEYRVFEDRLSSYFTLRCSEKPHSQGQSLYADVEWTGTDRTESFYGLKFTVQKADEMGTIWLWNNQNKIGIVIKNQ